jgi:Xaa-Pro aminopeptidase
VVLTVDGPCTLVSDVPWWREDLVVADEVRVTDDVAKSVAVALVDSGLSGKRVGLVGAQFMTAAVYLRLVAEAATIKFERLDSMVEELRIHKSDAERTVVRAAIGIANEAMDRMLSGLSAGATESEVVSYAAEHLERSGAVLLDAACSSGPAAHHYTWARLPSRDPIRALDRGDLFHVDFYGSFGGYYWDFARTRVVGDDPTDEQAVLIDSVTSAVEHVCSLIGPNVTAGALYAGGCQWLNESAALRELEGSGTVARLTYFGHGLGMGWEGPWLMADSEAILEEGDVVSVEYFLGRPDLGGVMMEQNGIVTAAGFELLTACPFRWHR